MLRCWRCWDIGSSGDVANGLSDTPFKGLVMVSHGAVGGTNWIY